MRAFRLAAFFRPARFIRSTCVVQPTGVIRRFRLLAGHGSEHLGHVLVHLGLPAVVQKVHGFPYIRVRRGGFPHRALRPPHFQTRRDRGGYDGTNIALFRSERFSQAGLFFRRDGERLVRTEGIVASAKTKTVLALGAGGKLRARGNFVFVDATGMLALRTSDNHGFPSLNTGRYVFETRRLVF